MRVSDFIALRLKFLGCEDVFMVTGGAAMHLNDSFGKEYSGHIHTLHHEQSCAMAAESYARVTFKPAILNVTAGPGGINAINGVFGAYVDSLPMIVISGQAKTSTMVSSYEDNKLRQLGDQEVDIVSMVEKVTKFATVIRNPLTIADLVDKCFVLSMSGRMGPVWLDVPIDIQGMNLPEEFEKFITRDINFDLSTNQPFINDSQVNNLAKKILSSDRPTLYVGAGVRLSDSHQEFIDFLADWPISTVTGWNSNDLLSNEHDCYTGRPGSVGNRAGNFSVQLSDCVLIVGCRLNIRQLSFNWESFARNAWTCHVDIDNSELNKPFLNTDLKVLSTVKGFFPRLSKELENLTNQGFQTKSKVFDKWLQWSKFGKKYLRIYHPLKEMTSKKIDCINPYFFINYFTSQLKESAITVCADGTACVVGFQAAIFKSKQRMFHNSGCASMGYEIPAAIGAYYASNQEINCIAGDGSIMMNLQELAYIGGLKLPIKIFVLNNKGYHSIRQTQQNYFPGNPVGCGFESGLPFPDFSKLSSGFGIDYLLINNEESLRKNIQLALSQKEPMLVEVILDLEQQFSPKLASKKLDDGSMITAELEDMSPLLDDEIMAKIRAEASNIK